ncbi:MAG: nitrile hydratase accessory protein [Mycobacterium sp.]|nr:nitrile hydratase accessory protein [Mycobacterium sp.]
MDVEGPAAPPRSNGELVFAEPWESRAFAMAVALCETGVFSWREFQEALITRIGRQYNTSTGWCYYEHWLGAVEDVLAGRGTVSGYDVTARARELAQRPAGHDHEQR